MELFQSIQTSYPWNHTSLNILCSESGKGINTEIKTDVRVMSQKTMKCLEKYIASKYALFGFKWI